METATQQRLQIDLKRNRAVKYATMVVCELSQAGYIASHCYSEAVHHLAEIFYKEDVEITTSTTRRANPDNV